MKKQDEVPKDWARLDSNNDREKTRDTSNMYEWVKFKLVLTSLYFSLNYIIQDQCCPLDHF